MFDHITIKLLNISTNNETVGGRVVHFLLQLSERWPCNILFVGRMKFASLVKFGLGLWPFSLYHSSFLSPSFWEEFGQD